MIKPISKYFSQTKTVVSLNSDVARQLFTVSEHLSVDAIRFFDVADLTEQGFFGDEWVCITNDTVFCFEVDAGKILIKKRVALYDVISTTLENLAGRTIFSVETKSATVYLASFTVAKSSSFFSAKECIKDIIAKKENPGSIKNTEAENVTSGVKNKIAKKARTFFRIMEFAKPYSGVLVLIFLFMLLSTCAGLATPYISKLFIDVIFKPTAAGVFAHASWLVPCVLLLFAAYALQVFLSGIQERFSGSLGYKTVHDVRQVIFKKLQELSLSYYDKHQTGGLLSRVNQDSADLQRLIVDFFPLTLQSVLLLFGVGAFLFVLSWQLTLFMFVPVIVTVVFVNRIFPRIGWYFRRYFHRRSRLNAFVGDSLSGVRVVKAFGREEREVDSFTRYSAEYRDSGIGLINKWSLYHPLLQFIIMCGGVMVWAIGGEYVLLKRMTVGSVVAYSGYLAMFYQPLLTLARMVELLSTSLTAAERVFSIMDVEPEIANVKEAVSLPSLLGTIEFKNVTFGYEKDKPVIKDLSFIIAAKEMVGLVGKSGSGKSTIINLICRFYDTDSGQILIDGVDIKTINLADLRRQVGVVLQETFLFNGSIYENIAYARPDATHEQVIDAAIAANVHEFVLGKPDGYDTEVGERGTMLSGGEKQRIAIARALLRDPAILILDEAMSSVDTQTEHKIQEALANLTKNRTTIAIAHRLSTLRSYNRLFVIENGQCVESGTHEALMKKQGAFYNLVTMQEKLSRIIDSKGGAFENT